MSMSVVAQSVYCVTGAAVMSAPFLARSPRGLAAMIADLDEEYINRIVWLSCVNAEWFEIMNEGIGGRRGLWHLLSQARLMTGIAIEASKRENVPDEAAQMRRKTRELWRAVGLCMFSPSGQAHVVGKTLSDMAACMENVLIEFDCQQVEGV